MLLWAVVILNLGTLSMSLPQISDKNFTAECVREHNEARSAVSPSSSDMLYMSWDEALAVTARAWAKHCQFKHNIYLKEVQRVHPTYHSVGENIWVGTPPSYFSVKGALRSWVNEKQFYSYEANSCKGMCGHYTQVVWANSYKVGCAVQLCPNGIKNFDGREGAIFVCNYAPSGNWFGKKPYAEGNSCSKCQDICEHGLCRSGERDKLRSYSWTPDWDPDNFSKNFKVILIVRPIFLILICISAYAVRYFYPDVFCYE
ncbi:GLIPR1-like protein 1 [Cyprinodon tularosa]|uniref:GLIPR1-like protein 1 n=1 Tax=Cyprinodon tularosa TaxID=77115 RepID=UPI0018E266BD|nr:GLIPR1-like protein 1 [Cyprinodon tularosa]